MTHEQMVAGLRALVLALHTRGFPERDPRLLIGVDDCAILFTKRDYTTHIIHARTPEAALAAAACWVNDAPLWTARDVRAAAE